MLATELTPLAQVRDNLEMRTPRHFRWKSWTLKLALAAILIAGWVYYRSPVRDDRFFKLLPGVYRIVGENGSAVPRELKNGLLTIRDDGTDWLKASGGDGRTLEFFLRRGKVCFKSVLPAKSLLLSYGLVKCWVEGEILIRDDRLVIEGRRLEQGASLLSGLHDIQSEWSVELKRISDPPPEEKPRSWTARY